MRFKSKRNPKQTPRIKEKSIIIRSSKEGKFDNKKPCTVIKVTGTGPRSPKSNKSK